MLFLLDASAIEQAHCTRLRRRFKAVYADPANKQILINLLNTVLPDDVRVSDIVEYRDREQTPDTIYSKKTVLDLVCKDVEGNIGSPAKFRV